MSLSIFGYAVLQNGDHVDFNGKESFVNGESVDTVDAVQHIANTAPVVKLSDGDLYEEDCDWYIVTNTGETSADNVAEANYFVKFYNDLN